MKRSWGSWIRFRERPPTAARDAGAETPTAAAVHEIYANARRMGYGGDNISGVAGRVKLKLRD